MLKKIFTMFILLAFCTTTSVFATNPQTASLSRMDIGNNYSNSYSNAYQSNYQNMNSIRKSEVFENNYQNMNNTNPVTVELSTIEKMYNGKENAVSGNVLYQVGYDQLNMEITADSDTMSSSTGKYDSSYKLSIGEKVNILSYGDSVDIISLSGSTLISPLTTTEVGSNGSIFVSGIGMVKAENRTIGEVENELNSLARKKYSNMKIKLQIPSGNGFSVFVYGEVNRPGKVYISANSSVLDALVAAGGVKKTGTLRNIKYNNKNVDLYNALFFGNDNGIILKANDKIFVDKIKKTVAIKNGVTVPGIYEFKTGEALSDIVKYAGDLLVTTQRDEVTLVSFDKSSNQRSAKNIPWISAKDTKLSDGDTVQFKELYNNVENIVTIQGNIKHPATYAYKEGMRLSDILKSEDELMEETFIYQAVIRRVAGKNNTVETIPVFLKEFFAGMNDPILQPRDVITVYKSTNSTFVDVYGCINLPKHIPYIEEMTLHDLMSDIQFIESEVSKQEVTKSFDSSKKGEEVQIKVSTENTNKLIPAENVAVEITDVSDTNTQIYYLYDIMINSDKIKSIKILPEDKVFFRTLRSNEIIKTVKVSGFVKKPGVYSFVKGQKLKDIIELAGGLSEDADLRGIVFKRANVKAKQVNLAQKNNERDIKLLEGRVASGYKQEETDQKMKLEMIEKLKEEQGEYGKQYTGQIALNIKTNDIDKIKKIDNVELQDGDDIYIPRISNYVTVLGEVYNEQSFIYTKGANVRRYIKQVGGYTPNANRFRLYKVGINGRAEKVHMHTKISAGDTIVVPRKVAGNDWITPICQTLQSLSSVFLMAFAIKRW